MVEPRERYTILGAIHRGGMGEILLARAEGADGFSKKVVLKGLLPALDDDPTSLELFRREARIMSRLEHPNVVRVLDFAYVGDKPYLAMEYVRGRNLHQVIQRARGVRHADGSEGLPPKMTFYIVAEALRGLHSAHTARDDDGSLLGAVHRDVSPGNVLLGFFGEVKVTDFGICKPAGAKNLTGPRAIRGKARYAPPEVIRGEPATPRSDVYAAGVVLAETLTGETLWDATGVSETLIRIVSEPREETLDRVLARAPEIAGLRAVLRRALSLKPEDRYPTAAAFAEALDQLARSCGGPTTGAELGAHLRELFAGAPDLPRDESGEGPVAPSDPPPPEDDDDDPFTRSPHPDDLAKVPGTLRPPHWSTRAPHDPTPRALRAPDEAPLSELVSLPSETSESASGGIDAAPEESPLDRLSRWQWALFLERRWVLVTVGILLGAGTALLGTLLATMHRW